MKKFQKYMALAAISVVLTACSDYFDVDIMDKQSTDISYNSVSNLDQALNGVYGCLRPLSTYYWQMGELRSDNHVVSVPSTARDASRLAHFDYSYLSRSSIISNCWNDLYKLQAAANKMLEEIEKVDYSTVNSKLATLKKNGEQLRKQQRAELRFLRALAYFDLVRMFGRVPATTKSLSVEESFALKQSEAVDVYNNIIIPDLRYAVENLDYTSFDYMGTTRAERATKPAAQGLLARVYITMAGYPLMDVSHLDEAKDLLKSIIDYSAVNSDKWWATNMDEWNKMWIHENDNKYFIFEIQYALQLNMGNPMTPSSVSKGMVNTTLCNTEKQLTGQVSTYAAEALRDHFVNGETDDAGNVYIDKRGVGTFNQRDINDDGTYDDDTDDKDMFNVKFFENIKKRSRLGYSSIDTEILTSTYWPQNFPILRFEDVLLMYAELEGPTGDGYKAINRIRERAGLVALSGLSSSEFQQAVRNERQYELVGEGFRWFDLVRWNIYVETMKDVIAKQFEERNQEYGANVLKLIDEQGTKCYPYPIPLSQIQVYDGLYEQNPGY